jgi:hypothetical protein
MCYWHADPALTVKATVPTPCTPPFPKFSAVECPRGLETRSAGGLEPLGLRTVAYRPNLKP